MLTPTQSTRNHINAGYDSTILSMLRRKVSFMEWCKSMPCMVQHCKCFILSSLSVKVLAFFVKNCSLWRLIIAFNVKTV